MTALLLWSKKTPASIISSPRYARRSNNSAFTSPSMAIWSGSTTLTAALFIILASTEPRPPVPRSCTSQNHTPSHQNKNRPGGAAKRRLLPRRREMSIGVDCELLLDGTGYFIKPGSYQMKQPRIRKATVRADGGLSYVDLGPGKRHWSMVILCLNDLLRYDGTPTGMTGQQYRDALRTSYTSSVGTTILYTDPL